METAIVNNNFFQYVYCKRKPSDKAVAGSVVRSSGFCFVVCTEEIKACFYADGNVPVERKKN